MSKKALVPELRFPEFRDVGEWEKHKIGELLILEYGASLPEEARQKGSIPVVGSNGVVGFHSEALVSGPVIVVGRKGSVGEVNLIESDCYPIDTTFYVKLKCQNCLLTFIKLLLENAELTSLADNGAVPGLNRNDVYVLKTVLPSKSEQQKIADCLSSIDELIELHIKKLEALKEHKKGLMQKLFPKEGETVPELRFPEFRDAGEWEVKRLGKIAKVYQPETISQSELTIDGKYFVYGANGIIGKFDKYNHATRQIAVTCRGSTCGEVTLTKPYSWITGNSMVVNVDGQKNVSKLFIFYFLKNSDLQYLITGSGQPQITGDLKEHKVYIPKFPEQQKIADCLSSIDELIDLHTKKLEALKQHKKGLMQKLFPKEVNI